MYVTILVSIGENMLGLLECLNKYSNIILAILTGLYVLLTYKILNANKTLMQRMALQAEEQKRAYINIRASDRAKAIVFLIIKNIGKTAATNVKFKLDKDIKRFGNKENLKEIPLFKEGVTFFPPESEYQIDVAQYWFFYPDEKNKTREVLPSEFKITCTYETLDKTYTEETIIDIKSTYKTNYMMDEGVEKLEDIANKLNSISLNLKSIGSAISDSSKEK